jgi:hypothetical protein
MKKLVLLTIIFIPVLSFSQITIDDGDMPETNVDYPQHTALVNGTDYMNEGAGVVWDFAYLTSLTAGTETYWPMDSVGITYYAIFGLPFDPNAANLVKPLLESPINLGIPIEDGYEFYSNKNAAFKMVGYGLEFSGIPIPIKHNNADVIYEFPLNYEDSLENNSDFSFSFPGMFYFGRETERNSAVDGWGTIYLPTDTFDVLRIKSLVTNKDTIYFDSTSTGLSLPPTTTTEYLWLAEGGGLPVLKVVDNGFTATAYYQADIDTTNLELEEFSEVEQFSVYPNPGKEFNIEFNIKVGSKVKIDVYDLQGRLIENVLEREFDGGSHSIPYQPGNLSPGMYLVNLKMNGSLASQVIQFR